VTNLIKSVCFSVLIAGALNAHAAQTLKEKMTPPDDSVERENVRIWVPVERPSSCRLVINIMDSSKQVVRHLLDYVASSGYYNFYWDKRDDSGRQVEPGIYVYEVDDCGTKKKGQLKAEFRKWERESRVQIDPDTTGFVLELLEDSAAVRIEWYDFKNRLKVRLYLDDEMSRGTYHFNWIGNREGNNIALVPSLRQGFYVQRVKVGEFVHEDTLRWPGN
jgi:flagellar hook assembly protein FlgD